MRGDITLDPRPDLGFLPGSSPPVGREPPKAVGEDIGRGIPFSRKRGDPILGPFVIRELKRDGPDPGPSPSVDRVWTGDIWIRTEEFLRG